MINGFRRGVARLAALTIVVTCVGGRATLAAEADPPGPAERREPLTLAYVANEGVLVAAGPSKVLIGALFDAPTKVEMVHEYYRDIVLLLPGMPARTFAKTDPE